MLVKCILLISFLNNYLKINYIFNNNIIDICYYIFFNCNKINLIQLIINLSSLIILFYGCMFYN